MKAAISFITFATFSLFALVAYLGFIGLTLPEMLHPTQNFAPEHQPHMSDTEIRAFVAQESPPITDDPSTWPESWGDADKSVQSCSSKGHEKNAGTHGRGGTSTNPTNCACMNECIKHGLVPGTNQFAQAHGDPRCKTTCRADTCKCKPPCV